MRTPGKVLAFRLPGMVADITLLGPATVRDNATCVKGTLPTTGIPQVIVNGTVVLRNARLAPAALQG